MTVNLKGLEVFKKALEKKMYTKVGILSSKDARNDAGSNAQIGAKHEFGSPSENVPARSFLRMPLHQKGQDVVKSMLKDKQILLKEIAKGNIKLFYKRLGVMAEAVIQEAFASRGFGQWEELKHREGSPLIDTGQLRDSIISEVING